MKAKKRKICFVTVGDLKNNASPKRAFGMANPMLSLGWEVSILMFDTEENRKRAKAELSPDVKSFFYNFSSVSVQRKEKNRLVYEIDPDVLFIGYMFDYNVIARKHRSIKIVEHCELYSKHNNNTFKSRLHHLFMEFYSIIYSDGLMCASKYLMDIFSTRRKRILQNKVKMLYMPYAYNPEMTIVKNEADINEIIKIYKQQKTFVYLGSVTRTYGVFTILEAAKLLNEKDLVFKVLILGGGKDLDEVRVFVNENNLENCIELMGFVEEEDISDYFSVASAFISPMNDNIQDWSRCPSKLYMYLPYKKPIITCKIGEPYATLGEEGLYYTSGDSMSLSKKMLDVIENRKDHINIDCHLHTWSSRALVFSNWIEEQWIIDKK